MALMNRVKLRYRVLIPATDPQQNCKIHSNCGAYEKILKERPCTVGLVYDSIGGIELSTVNFHREL